MTNGRDVLVHVQIIRDDFFLARRLRLRNLHRRQRMRHSVGNLFRPVLRTLEPEQLVHDIHVRQEVGDGACVRLSLDMVEEHDGTAVQVLLNSGDLQIGIYFYIRLQDIPLRVEPL